MDALKVDGLKKNFGGTKALDGVSFTVEKQSLTGLIGPNGAGKTTTFDCIIGIENPDQGSIFLGENEITGLNIHKIIQKGIARTFQITRELGNMTIIENLMVGYRNQIGESVWRALFDRKKVIEQEKKIYDRANELLEFFELKNIKDNYASDISGGQRKLLELARALMLDPDIVLLDEPFAGVNPTLQNKLLKKIKQLKKQGYTFFLIEHDMEVVMENCEDIIVMDQGRVIAEGKPEEIKENQRVIDAYFSSSI